MQLTLNTSATDQHLKKNSTRSFKFWAEIVFSAILLSLPLLINSAYVQRLVLDVAIFSIVVLGLVLVFGYTGQISIGQAAFYAAGGYSAAILQTTLGVPWYISWPVAILISALFAYIISVPLLRVHGHFLALGTLALSLIVEMLLIQFVDFTGGRDGIIVSQTKMLGEVKPFFPYIVMIALVLAYWLVRNLTDKSLGRAMLALRDDPAGAAALGIQVTHYKTVIFGIAGGMSGAAGVLYAHHVQVVTPEAFGWQTSIDILLVVILGGMLSRFGAIIGSFVLIVFPEIFVELQEYKNLVVAALVLAVLLFFPGGIVGMFTSIGEKLKKLSAKKEVAQ